MNLTVNGQPETLAPSPGSDGDTALTVADLLAHHGLTGQPVAVEVNQQLVPKRDHATTQLQDGDTVEMVTLVGGG